MKSFKLLRLAQKGFSLVEIMIAMGLISLAGVAVMSLTDNINTNTVKAEAMMAKAQFASALGQHLNSTLGCEEVMNKSMSINSSSPTEMTLTKWDVHDKYGKKVDLQKDVEFKYFKVKSITGYIDQGTPAAPLPQVVISGVPHKRTQVMVKTTVSVPMNSARDYNGKGIRDYEYFYNIPVLVNSSNVVKFCSEDKSLRETCIAMKGVFDEATGTCELNKTCKLMGTYQILSCSPSSYGCSTINGSSKVNSQTGGYSCPSGSTPDDTGVFSWTHDASCGKKCTQTITNTMRWYSCMACPGTSSAPSAPSTSGGGGGGGPGGGGGGGCFVAGTQIALADGLLKNIEDVKAGEKLLDGSGKIVTVKRLVSYDYDGEIYSINGGRHFFTPNHPFLTIDGWKSLDPVKSMEESPGLTVTLLREGDVLVKKDGLETLFVLDGLATREKVFNFNVSDSHEYIADDFIVHNLKPGPSGPIP